MKDNINIFNAKILEYKDIINEKNTEGETLLNICVYNGLIENFYILMEHGSKPNLTNEKNNLLHYAAYSGKDPFLIIELVKMGIKPSDKNIYGETSLHLSIDSKISHYLYLWGTRNQFDINNIIDNENNTVLHSSAIYGHKQSVDYWIKNKKIKDMFNNNLKFTDILLSQPSKKLNFLKESQ